MSRRMKKESIYKKIKEMQKEENWLKEWLKEIRGIETKIFFIDFFLAISLLAIFVLIIYLGSKILGMGLDSLKEVWVLVSLTVLVFLIGFWVGYETKTRKLEWLNSYRKEIKELYKRCKEFEKEYGVKPDINVDWERERFIYGVSFEEEEE